jgi:hypothetical protein
MNYFLLVTQIVLLKIDSVKNDAEPERAFGDAKKVPNDIMIGDPDLEGLFSSSIVWFWGWGNDRSHGQCDRSYSAMAWGNPIL